MSTPDEDRKSKYLQLCKDTSKEVESDERLLPIDSPFFSWSARELLHPEIRIDRQHALLGHIRTADGDKEPVLLNTEHPWSAFICGSQGSGKSYTTSCILEGCLSKHDRIGTLQQPMAGMVFRYDRYGSGICEAATLCTGDASIKVEVLLSPFNYKQMEAKYRKIKAPKGSLEIKPFYLKSSYLNAERIQKFMASGDGSKPLYMSVVDRVLREMGIANQGPGVSKSRAFSYPEFKKRLEAEDLTEFQRAPLNLRLSLLDSYMQQTVMPTQVPQATTGIKRHKAKGNTPKTSTVLVAENKVEDTLDADEGCLKILDLTDPHLDRSGACALFDLALAVFLKSEVPKIIALDEAHNYLSEGEESGTFTEDLLKVVREQRHTGSRLLIATQEPTISTKFLDLCNITIVHRFTSPDWFRALRGHLGGASAEAGVNEDGVKELFKQIGQLRVGESLVFAPTAMLDVENDEVTSLNFGWKLMKTRKRITDDGGKSLMAQEFS